jgi:DNA sulfur modification protein DndC
MMELPPFGENALALIKYISEIGERNSLPLRTHMAAAPIEHRFWFLVLGKGYPPPHNHFRWCTERLKIWPSSRIMKKFITESSVVLTGVRWGESAVGLDV